MKIQYPGVAKGIESDINNLVTVMNVWNILPKGASLNLFWFINQSINVHYFSSGMYLDEFIKVAKLELSWEVDYVREAECTKRFASLVKDMPYYKVPEIIGNFQKR